MTATVTKVNYRSVAILPLSTEVPLGNFTRALYQKLSAIRSTILLTSDVKQGSSESSNFDPNNEEELESWPEQQAQYISLYQCDMSLTEWTEKSVQRADIILIIGVAGERPDVREIEQGI
jgi:hypothetical protein